MKPDHNKKPSPKDPTKPAKKSASWGSLSREYMASAINKLYIDASFSMEKEIKTRLDPINDKWLAGLKYFGSMPGFTVALYSKSEKPAADQLNVIFDMLPFREQYVDLFNVKTGKNKKYRYIIGVSKRKDE